MKKLHFIILSVVLLMLGMTGCKSSRSVTSDVVPGVQPTAVLQEVASSYRSWETYSVSGKVSMSGVASLSSSMQLKMVKGKCVLISIRPILGIEVAKMYIDNDSAVVVNKLNKTYTSLSLSQFAEILPMDINIVQDMILARVFDLKEGELSLKNLKKFEISSDADNFTITPRKKRKDFAYEFMLNKAKQLTALSVSPASSSKTYTAQYSGYAKDAVGNPASNIKFATSLRGKNVELNLNLNTTKGKWDGNVDEYFSVGMGYKKLSIAEFLTSLKSF